MPRIVIYFLCVFASAANALATDDPLAVAYTACLPHRAFPLDSPAPGPLSLQMLPYAGAWVHCKVIEDAFNAREKAARDGDEARNPDLKMTRAIAAGLAR